MHHTVDNRKGHLAHSRLARIESGLCFATKGPVVELHPRGGFNRKKNFVNDIPFCTALAILTYGLGGK